MSEQEQEREAALSEDPDVEGHRTKAGYGDEGSEEEIGRRASDDDPDVEAHRTKAG
ncbi:MAG TPA: hypothetical protein VGJ49_09765 [Gaiellaceae bacterium]|jgi:hypothetical protein